MKARFQLHWNWVREGGNEGEWVCFAHSLQSAYLIQYHNFIYWPRYLRRQIQGNSREEWKYTPHLNWDLPRPLIVVAINQIQIYVVWSTKKTIFTTTKVKKAPKHKKYFKKACPRMRYA
jgi:hypothetical protein